eukprot:8834137-Alexandrium_andersonii.AAC.1
MNESRVNERPGFFLTSPPPSPRQSKPPKQLRSQHVVPVRAACASFARGHSWDSWGCRAPEVPIVARFARFASRSLAEHSVA